MQPKRKDICDCGVLEKASQEPNHPIRWDEKLNEYFIAYRSGGRMMVYYCPFCGGSTPQSRRASLFAHVTHEEEPASSIFSEEFAPFRMSLADLVRRTRTTKLHPPSAPRPAAANRNMEKPSAAWFIKTFHPWPILSFKSETVIPSEAPGFR